MSIVGSAAVAILAACLVSSVNGFAGLMAPVSLASSSSRSTTTGLFVSATLDANAAVSIGNDSLHRANQLAGNILPEQMELLGHAQQQQTTSSASSSRRKQTPSPVEMEQQQRRTKISASVKETGYDSINNYMVRVG